MSTSPIPGLEKLERRTPLPSLSQLLSSAPLPNSDSALPPLKDLLPPLAKLPKMSPIPPSKRPQERLAPIPPTESLADRVSRSMEDQHHFSKIPTHPPVKQKETAFPPPIETKEAITLSSLPETSAAPLSSPSERIASPEMSYPIPSPFEPKEQGLELPDENSPAQLAPPQQAPAQEAPPVKPAPANSGTDEDLIEALLPIVESSLEKALYAPQTGLHTYLEPMLRSTVRRAIAEQMQTAHHFDQISTADKLTWRMKALFSSQTFDDIVFDRTHRYQVEEVFLMRYDTFSLISYASHDPSRHANPKKIRYDLSRLMADLKDADGALRKTFNLPEKRVAVIRQGRHGFLVAVIRGRANALVRADLDYILEQVEQRFEKRLRAEGHHFIHALQPILESCLLIQSPAPPR